MKFNNLYRLLSEKLGVDEETDRTAAHIIEEIKRDCSSKDFDKQKSDRNDKDNRYDYTYSFSDKSISYKGKTVIVAMKVNMREFESHFTQNDILQTNDIRLIKARFIPPLKEFSTYDEPRVELLFSALREKFDNGDKFFEEFKKLLPSLQSVIAHELKHAADWFISNDTFNPNELAFIEEMRWNGISAEATDQYKDRYIKMCKSICRLMYHIQTIEVSVAANEVAAEIRAKKQSEYLTTSEFLAFFYQTRYVRKLTPIKSVKAEYDSLKAESGISNFDKVVGEDVCNYVTYVARRRFTWKSMDEVVMKCNELLKRLARMYDLFAPPNTKKY